ncbi:hypothetical protein [Gaetbulibacter sp. PBL-D1]|uniref:hypothetical protein n=1 Tax=Gaetbulibacter sp. PBL-D1 TaxID=3422594 RepID=UPI003D2F3177
MIKTNYIARKIKRGFDIRDRRKFPNLSALNEWLSVYTQDEYDSNNHKLINPRLDLANNRVVCAFRNKTTQELQLEATAISEANKSAIIKAKLEENAITELTNTNNIEQLLANQDLFPHWKSGEDVVPEDELNNILPTRRLDFNTDNELVLWECLQPHTTQEDWRPKDTPALWKRVALPNEYLVWVQPTGAHDAYGVDDVIWYPTEGSTLYISTVNGNVYPPGIVAGQWEVYNP